MISYAPEVIADSSGKWTGNGLRFATREEAEANVADLAIRWYLVTDTRVVESDDPVNYEWVAGYGLRPVRDPDDHHADHEADAEHIERQGEL